MFSTYVKQQSAHIYVCTLCLKNIKLPVEMYAPVPRFKWHQYFGSIYSSPPPTAIPQCTSVSTGLPCVNDTLSFILFYASSSPLLLLALPWVVINLLHKFMSHFLFVLLGCRSKIKPDKYTKWTLRAAAINPPPMHCDVLVSMFYELLINSSNILTDNSDYPRAVTPT